MTANQLLDQLNLEHPLSQYVESSTRDAALEPPASIIKSACPVKATISGLAAIESRTDPPCKPNSSPLRSLTIKCDNAYRLLPLVPGYNLFAYTGLPSEALQQQQKLTPTCKQKQLTLEYEQQQSKSYPKCTYFSI